jgi:hypothetical protein
MLSGGKTSESTPDQTGTTMVFLRWRRWRRPLSSLSPTPRLGLAGGLPGPDRGGGQGRSGAAHPLPASYGGGALPIPPVGPPPSELRRAIRRDRLGRSDLSGRRPRSPRPAPRCRPPLAATRRHLAVGRGSCLRPDWFAGARPPRPAEPPSTPADPGATFSGRSIPERPARRNARVILSSERPVRRRTGRLWSFARIDRS